MWELKKKSDKLQQELLTLIERDAEVFEPLSKAYGMPRTTEEEKAESKSNGNCFERCLFRTHGDYGKMLRGD